MTATLVATPDPDDGPSKTTDPDWEEFVEAHSPDEEYDLVELFKYRRRGEWDEWLAKNVEEALEEAEETGYSARLEELEEQGIYEPPRPNLVLRAFGPRDMERSVSWS